MALYFHRAPSRGGIQLRELASLPLLSEKTWSTLIEINRAHETDLIICMQPQIEASHNGQAIGTFRILAIRPNMGIV